MEFKINTAYDIGCSVFVSDFDKGYKVAGPYTITSIEIDINTERTKVAYCVNNGEAFIGCFLEDKLFKTNEECTQWCQKHS